MLIVSKFNVLDKVNSITREIMENLNVKADIRTLKIEEKGAEILGD